MSIWWTPDDELFAKYYNSLKYSIVADLIAGLPDSFDLHSPLRDVEKSYTHYQAENYRASIGRLLQAIRKTYNYFIGDAMIYSDRGDPSVFDFTLTDFTTDDTWRDLDLSSIIPANTKAVIVHICISAPNPNYCMQFRKKGNVNEINIGATRQPVKDIQTPEDLILAVDENRFIQYKGSPLAFDIINFVVKGWFIL